MSAPELGRALFRARGSYPLPLLLAQLVWAPGLVWPVAGVGLVLAGEALRVWAAGCIGLPSRTRGDAVGPLVRTGPYAAARNPLYLGNLSIWVGVGLSSGPLWAALWALWIGVQVSLVVRWEERQLSQQLGAPYADYRAQVPRWWPRRWPGWGAWSPGQALRSERSTLLALTAVCAARAVVAAP